MFRNALLASASICALLLAPACERISAEKVFPEYMAEKKAAQKEAMQRIEEQNRTTQQGPSFFPSATKP
jgi:hypothetical protein